MKAAARASRSKDNKTCMMSGKRDKNEGEFKAVSTTTKDLNEEIKNGRILCYVCGGNGANWSLYTKENEVDKSPYFPFLQSIEKAEGAQPIRSNGRIDACTLCFSFLVQQWRSYEESDTPVSKRTYWLKRSGPVSIDTLNLNLNEENKEPYATAGKSHEIMESGNQSESVDDVQSLESNSPDVSGLDENKDEIINNKRHSDELLSTTQSYNNTKLWKESKDSKSKQSETPDTEIEQTCCSCGQPEGIVLLKTVHTKPQLKTETPFYPFLAQRSPKVDFMGKVAVCKSCEVYLFKQWGRYERLHVPLSERYYTLLSAQDAQKEIKVDMFVCFLCGNKHPQTSAQNVHAKKGNAGVPYFPFLLRHLPRTGAREISEAGTCEVCELCHKSLIHQWNEFEDAGFGMHDREYKVGKRDAFRNSDNIKSNVRHSWNMQMCPVCKKMKSKDEMDYICAESEDTIASTNDSVDRQGRNLVCCDCKKTSSQSRDRISHVKPLESPKSYGDTTVTRSAFKNSTSLSHNVAPNTHKHESSHFETCFLCGEKVNALSLEYLHVFPRQYVNGFRPFFPSLAYRVPAYHAKPPSALGTVITCNYCHGNMINQWHECEKHEQHGISNPWVRQYVFSQFTCYLCSNAYPRQKVTTVSSSDFPFLAKVRRPARGFRINNEMGYVVCQHCKEIVNIQKENFDKCKVDVSERDYELPMIQFDSSLANKVCLNIPNIVYVFDMRLLHGV